VSVYKYTVRLPEREDAIERGTVVASNEQEAKLKLKNLELTNPKLKEIKGVLGLYKRFTADVK